MGLPIPASERVHILVVTTTAMPRYFTTLLQYHGALVTAAATATRRCRFRHVKPDLIISASRCRR